MQYQIDQENREAAHTQSLEKAISELYVRTEPIGQDRHFRTYWCFDGDERLFVQFEKSSEETAKGEPEEPSRSSSGNKGTPNKKKAVSSPGTAVRGAAATVEEEVVVDDGKAALLRLIDSKNRPSRHRYSWKVLKTENELWSLLEALDERGERERQLKKCIKAKFDLQGEPPVKYTYISEGSEYIGRKVKRTFGKVIYSFNLF